MDHAHALVNVLLTIIYLTGYRIDKLSIAIILTTFLSAREIKNREILRYSRNIHGEKSKYFLCCSHVS